VKLKAASNMKRSRETSSCDTLPDLHSIFRGEVGLHTLTAFRWFHTGSQNGRCFYITRTLKCTCIRAVVYFTNFGLLEGAR